MNKQDFLDKANQIAGSLGIGEIWVKVEDYPKIEYVYNFHPSISETRGKDQIAYLYVMFGMRVIEDMLPTAKLAEEYEAKIRSLRAQLEELNNEFHDFQLGKVINHSVLETEAE